MAMLCEPDAASWEEAGAEVSEVVAGRLHAGVLANRSLREAGDGSWLWPSLSAARTAAHRLVSTSDWVLQTDIRSFYPSVTPSAAFAAIARLGLSHTARDVAQMLEGWGSEGYSGLPIGPPASAVMANAILMSVDETIGRLPFLRWVDDYLIAVPRERDLATMLDIFDSALVGIGLERSPTKTKLRPCGIRSSWPGTYGRRRPSE